MEAIPFSIEKYNDLVRDKQSHILLTNSKAPVRILCTDRQHQYCPIVGIVLYVHEQNVTTWTLGGINNGDNNKNLIIVPKPPVSLGWVAVLLRHGDVKDVSVLYPDKEALLATVGARMLSEPIEIFAKP